MSDAPQTLSRPLADRVKGLKATHEPNNDIPGPESIIAPAVAALQAGKTKYTDRPGIIGLRQWVSDHLREKYGLDIAPDAVTITCGVEEAEYVALKCFTDWQPGGLLTADHTDDDIYLEHLQPTAKLLGVTIADYTVDGPKFMAALMQGQREPQPEHFVPPTGELAAAVVVEDGAKTNALLHLARERSLPILWTTSLNLSDVHLDKWPDLIPNTVIAGSFSWEYKGWRMGWLAGHAQHAKLRSFKQSMTICSPSISQWALLGVLEGDNA